MWIALEAARALCSAMGLSSVARLPRCASRDDGQRPQASPYHGVSFHVGIARWVVNGAAVGTFDTAAEAAAALKKSCPQVADKNTKKQKPGKKFSVQKKFNVQRGGRKRKVSPKQLLIRIRCLSKIYNRGGQLHMPADVDSFMAHNIVAHEMHTAEPTMQMVAMHLKYKPWMDAVHAAWRACSHTSNFQRSSRAGRMWMALVAAVRLIDEDPVDQKWVQHAGRKVCRHSGGAQVMVSLGILRVGGRGLAPVRLCQRHLKPGHHLLLGKRSSAKSYLHVVGGAVVVGRAGRASRAGRVWQVERSGVSGGSDGCCGSGVSLVQDGADVRLQSCVCTCGRRFCLCLCLWKVVHRGSTHNISA